MKNLNNTSNLKLGNTNSQIQPNDSEKENLIITYTAPSQNKKFPIFIFVIFIITSLVWIGVGYLYLTNKNLKEATLKLQNLNLASKKTSSSTSTSVFEQISIAGGNVVKKNENGEIKILVNKSDYPSTGIIGFVQVTVSYDENLMCFESRSPAQKPAIYIANINGGEVTEISPDKVNCMWAKSSKGVFYTDTPIMTKPVNIYMYDIEAKVETNLTKSVIAENATRQFELVSVSDNGLITCTFKDFNKSQEEVKSGNCTIDISGETPVYSES